MPNTRFSQRLLTLKRNENPDSQEPAQRRPLGRKKVVQTLREVKKHKRKSLSGNRKTQNQKREKESEEGSDSYGTPHNDSDSPTSEKTKAQTKQWENYQD